MSWSPSGETVEIVGIRLRDTGRTCKEHLVCGLVLKDDTVVRLRKTQVVIDGVEQTAIAAIWVSDGIDCCRVGFLQHHHVAHWKKYEGVIAQITEVYTEKSESPAKRQKYHKNIGCALAALISPPIILQENSHATAASAISSTSTATTVEENQPNHIVFSPQTNKCKKTDNNSQN